MNKHLHDIRVKSLAHYTEQIKQLEEVLKTTRSTKEDLLQSCIEFCPLKEGDIVMTLQQTFKKVEKVGVCSFDSGNMELKYRIDWLYVYKQEWRKESYDYSTLTLEELKGYKIID